MMDFSSMKFILSDLDLQKLLKNCPRCQKSCANGRLIMYHENLIGFNIQKLRKQKIAIILNSEKNNIGHWVTLLISRSPSNFAIYMDSENKLKHENPEVFFNIKNFCNRNNLKLIDRSFRNQKLGNYNCGFHVLDTIAKFVHLSHSKFTHYIDALKSNPIEKNENRIFQSVKKHFK